MPKTITFICKICDKRHDRVIYPSTKGTFEYCSVACRNAGISRGKVVKGEVLNLQKCPACGKSGRRKQPYCNEHFDRITIWDKDKVSYLKANYQDAGAERIAKHLGLTLVQVRDKANRLGLVLSKEAAHKIIHSKAKEYMIKNNPMFRDGPKEKLRQYWIDHPDERQALMTKLAEGRAKFQKGNPTKLEIKLFDILDSLGVDHEPFFLVKPRFIVDCRIGNLIIQADGEYWHGHPRFEPLTDRQKGQQKRDKAQDKYLTTCGYAVERIWEHDMSKDVVIGVLSKHGIIHR